MLVNANRQYLAQRYKRRAVVVLVIFNDSETAVVARNELSLEFFRH